MSAIAVVPHGALNTHDGLCRKRSVKLRGNKPYKQVNMQGKSEITFPLVKQQELVSLANKAINNTNIIH